MDSGKKIEASALGYLNLVVKNHYSVIKSAHN